MYVLTNIFFIDLFYSLNFSTTKELCKKILDDVSSLLNAHLSNNAAAENWVWRFVLFVLLTIKKFNCIFVVVVVIVTKCYLYLARSIAYRFGTSFL